MVSEGLLSIHRRLQIHCIVNVNICIKGPDDRHSSSASPCKYLHNYCKKNYVKSLQKKERKQKYISAVATGGERGAHIPPPSNFQDFVLSYKQIV